MTPTAVLQPPDLVDGEHLTVSLKGDTVAAGNPFANAYTGEAYVFVKPPGGWTNTTETAKLTASDGAANNELGFSAAGRRRHGCDGGPRSPPTISPPRFPLVRSLGPSGKFATGHSYGLVFTCGPGDSCFQYKGGGTLNGHRGNFKFGQTNYVGFRFLLPGQYHYGWVRVEVVFHRNLNDVIAETGIPAYAYESAADTAIVAGNCPAPELSSTGASPTNGASLALLALGHQGISRSAEK